MRNWAYNIAAFQGLPCQNLWFSSLPYGLNLEYSCTFKLLLKQFAEMKSVLLIRALLLFTECWLCWAKLFTRSFPEFEQAKHWPLALPERAVGVRWGATWSWWHFCAAGRLAVPWDGASTAHLLGLNRNTGQGVVAYYIARRGSSLLWAIHHKLTFCTVTKYHFSR